MKRIEKMIDQIEKGELLKKYNDRGNMYVAPVTGFKYSYHSNRGCDCGWVGYNSVEFTEGFWRKVPFCKYERPEIIDRNKATIALKYSVKKFGVKFSV